MSPSCSLITGLLHARRRGLGGSDFGTASGRPCLPAVQDVRILTKPTKPIEGQKTGTSGLRKKTNVFTGENYLANW